MRVRICVPHKAAEHGVHAAAGDVLNVRGALAKVLIQIGAAVRTTDPVGPWVAPERPVGYVARQPPPNRGKRWF